MSVLINFKICDNAKECNGIAVCPTGALSWDKDKKSIALENSKCISCGKCEQACLVGAIKVAKTKEEYDKLKKEILKDKRRTSDLFVDRYGATPITKIFLIDGKKFDVEVLESSKLTVAELFNDESIQCLFYSIPIKELFGKSDIKYRKVKLEDNYILKRYGVEKLPALLFFKGGRLLGKIEGYYDLLQKKDMLAQIKKLFKCSFLI